MQKDYDKENQQQQRRPRPPPAVGYDQRTGAALVDGSADIYENIDVKDINSKLSRLQDLLKMAKNQ